MGIKDRLNDKLALKVYQAMPGAAAELAGNHPQIADAVQTELAGHRIDELTDQQLKTLSMAMAAKGITDEEIEDLLHRPAGAVVPPSADRVRRKITAEQTRAMIFVRIFALRTRTIPDSSDQEQNP